MLLGNSNYLQPTLVTLTKMKIILIKYTVEFLNYVFFFSFIIKKLEPLANESLLFLLR